MIPPHTVFFHSHHFFESSCCVLIMIASSNGGSWGGEGQRFGFVWSFALKSRSHVYLLFSEAVIFGPLFARACSKRLISPKIAYICHFVLRAANPRVESVVQTSGREEVRHAQLQIRNYSFFLLALLRFDALLARFLHVCILDLPSFVSSLRNYYLNCFPPFNAWRQKKGVSMHFSLDH